MYDIYLASPYSHTDPAAMEMRYVMARDVAHRLIFERGLSVYSPIVFGHDFCVANRVGRGWTTWERQDRAMIACAGAFWVAMLPGWRESVGIKAEAAYWLELHGKSRPVGYLEPTTLAVQVGPPMMIG